jgi:FixJ family two-component response regulator
VINIIEDDKSVQRGYQLLLRSANLESKTFDSADYFLKTWHPCESDILILDIHMYGMDGGDLLAHLEERNVHLPVIVVTAFDEEKSRTQAEHYGVLGYLIKPFNPEELLKLINSEIIKK